MKEEMKRNEELEAFKKEIITLSEITYPNGTCIHVRYLKKFLGCFLFDSKDIEMAQATTLSNDGLEAILIIANFEQLTELGFSTKEIRSILAHEAGHLRVSNRNHGDIEAEIQADQYACNKFGKISLITSLLRCLRLFSLRSPALVNQVTIRLSRLGVYVTDIYSYDGVTCEVEFVANM